MEFDPIPPDVISEYVAGTGHRQRPMSVILTDGTMLSGGYTVGNDPAQSLTLEAFWRDDPLRVEIPTERIAGILEHVTASPFPKQALDPARLFFPARQAGLEVDVPGGIFDYIHLGTDKWVPAEKISYEGESWLYLDSATISARSGGINNIGLSAPPGIGISLGWQSKLVNKAKRSLRHHFVDIGAHCAEPGSEMTLQGYAAFFDVSEVQPSPDSGPLLELEGTRWVAAIVHRSPSVGRSEDDPWALCYFREDCLTLGAGNWELIAQPICIYGDKHPLQQTLEPGVVAPCYVMVRAAMVFPDDALCPSSCRTVAAPIRVQASASQRRARSRRCACCLPKSSHAEPGVRR